MYLHLEDGQHIEGESFGYDGVTSGEVVFTTGMTGYPQSLTDPSFAGQILVFTYPLLGNYGVPKETLLDKHLMANFESEHIWVSGVIVSSNVETPSHYQMSESFSFWLKKHKIPALANIDTRALTQKLREKGVMRGTISKSKTFDWDPSSVANLVPRVSLPEVISYKPKKSVGFEMIFISSDRSPFTFIRKNGSISDG